MNHEKQDLINKALNIIDKTGTKPGTRYPSELKSIVIALRLDHQMSVRDVTKYVGVSTYSAREWPKDFNLRNNFSKLLITKPKSEKIKLKSKNKSYSNQLDLIIFNLKVLIMLITLLIFESITFHLIL